MTPPASYWLVVRTPALSFLSQPRALTSAVRSVRRPCLERSPAVALPLLYSMRSGASEELRTIGAVLRICSKPFSSNSTSTPGWVFSNSSIAAFQAMPIALSGPS